MVGGTEHADGAGTEHIDRDLLSSLVLSLATGKVDSTDGEEFARGTFFRSYSPSTWQSNIFDVTKNSVRPALDGSNSALFGQYVRLASYLKDQVGYKSDLSNADIKNEIEEELKNLYSEQQKKKEALKNSAAPVRAAKKLFHYAQNPPPDLEELSEKSKKHKKDILKETLQGNQVHLAIVPKGVAKEIEIQINRIYKKYQEALKKLGVITQEDIDNQAPSLPRGGIGASQLNLVGVSDSSAAAASSISLSLAQPVTKTGMLIAAGPRSITTENSDTADPKNNNPVQKATFSPYNPDPDPTGTLYQQGSDLSGALSQKTISGDDEDKIKVAANDFVPDSHPARGTALEHLIAALLANLREFSLGSITLISAAAYFHRLNTTENIVDRMLELANKYELEERQSRDQKSDLYQKSNKLKEALKDCKKFQELLGLLAQLDPEALPNNKKNLGAIALKFDKFFNKLTSRINEIESLQEPEDKKKKKTQFEKDYGIKYDDNEILDVLKNNPKDLYDPILMQAWREKNPQLLASAQKTVPAPISRSRSRSQSNTPSPSPPTIT